MKSITAPLEGGISISSRYVNTVRVWLSGHIHVMLVDCLIRNLPRAIYISIPLVTKTYNLLL